MGQAPMSSPVLGICMLNLSSMAADLGDFSTKITLGLNTAMLEFRLLARYTPQIYQEI